MTEHTIPCQHIREYPYGVRDDQADIALAVKQYQPLDNLEARDGDVTIIGAHANGLTKVRNFYRVFDNFERNARLCCCYS